MKKGVSGLLILQITLFLLLGVQQSLCYPLSGAKHSISVVNKIESPSPVGAPSSEPQPFLPLLAPSPLGPFTDNSLPKLSGLCSLNFSAADNITSTTAADCWASFAPYLANVVCCPQFDAWLVTLLGQSSKYSGMLALNTSHASHCLSDVKKILVSQGANEDLKNICSVRPKNLTEGACPIVAVDEFESIIDSSRLLTACRKIDPVNECCDQVCQNAINHAAGKIASTGVSNLGMNHSFSEQTRVDDCKNLVLRWLASKLDPTTANSVFRGLSNCKLNKVCPLILPNVTSVAEECGNVIRNHTACCKAVKSYVSFLQDQSFITNLQAVKCAATLGKELQKVNVSNNVYDLCHISLKDFSLQESGCLLPSLPSDAILDRTTGIGFICDLNDNMVAPWPSKSYTLASSCNRTTKLPSLPTATSVQNAGVVVENLVSPLIITSLLLVNMLL